MADAGAQNEFANAIDVSRETMERLGTYESLLRKWNPKINLVSASTLDEVWSRHFLDSAQLLDVCRKTSGHWVDLGTGGGFPGMVVATIAAEKHPGFSFTMVEADARKATFLRTVSRQLGVQVRVIAERIESLPPLAADVLSARALAPLPRLLALANPHLKPDAQALFPKGATFREELAAVDETWLFQIDEYPSKTDANAIILSFGAISRV